jgi:predicted Zn-dependent protease
VRELEAELARRVAAGGEAPLSVEPDATTRAELRGLGYVAGEPAVAAQSLGRVGGTDPKDGRGVFESLAQAQILLHEGRIDAALALLRPLGDAPVVAGQRAAVAIGAGRLEEAERDARAALAALPERDDVRLLLARALLGLGRQAEADAELARLGPEQVAAAPWAALRRAHSADSAGDPTTAIDLLERAHARHPQDLAVCVSLAGLLERAGRLEEALAVRESARRAERGP